MLDFQKVLLSLYLDEKFIQKYYANQHGVLKKYVLTEKERGALLSLPRSTIEDEHVQLWRKSYHYVQKFFASPYGKHHVYFLKNFRRGPQLFFFSNDTISEESITHGVSAILDRCMHMKYTLSAYNIITSALACLRHTAPNTPAPTLHDVYTLIRLTQKHNLNRALVHTAL